MACADEPFDCPGPQAGAAILEFALVLPILLALLGGVFEFGRILLVRHALIVGAHSGARYLARVPDPTCGRTACTPGASHAIALARETILAMTGATPASLTVEPGQPAGTGLVAIHAIMTLDVDLLRFVGLGPAFKVEATAEEPRIGE